MTRTLFIRVPLLAALLALTASFSTPIDLGLRNNNVKTQLRVTRHFAAGLEYLLIEPRDAAPDAELPMIIALHGRSDRPHPPRDAFLDLDTPVRVIMPRGPLPHGDGYAWMPVSAHHGDSAALSGSLRRRVHELSSAMLEWRQRYPTRGLPIVTGFSQGGILAATLAITHPESLSRAFVMAGWIPTSFEPARFDPYAPHAPIHALHGTDDGVIGTARTHLQFDRLRAMGFPFSYEPIPQTAHERSPEMIDRLRLHIRRALQELPRATRDPGTS